MRRIDLTVEICGSGQGDGTLAAGEILTNTLSSIGYHLMSFDVYPAEIRGFGKCVAHTRISDQPLFSIGRGVDILVSLHDPYSIEQLPNLKSRAVVLFDSGPIKDIEEDECIAGKLGPGMYLYGVPLLELSQRTTQSSRSRNIVALGAFAALFDIDAEAFLEGMRRKFRKKPEVAKTNESAFMAGVEYAQKEILKLDPLSFKLDRPLEKKNYQLLTGNEAVAQSAIDAKCRFFAGYPITPATKIMELLSEKLPAEGGVVVQTEDEISAIGMVTGAALVGTRAMTATSGPGLCLMTEFIGYNVMTENSVVIVDSQRAGPATGLPTKTEQSDLMMALYAGNGDAPRIVIAPTNITECHHWVAEAFYLAEKYQVPVIVLLDLFLSSAKGNAILHPIDGSKLSANKFPTPEQLKNYKRLLITDDGVSPKTIPGTPGGEWVISGLEQNEAGSPLDDGKTHSDMSAKRYLKLKTALKNDIPRPERFGKNGKVKLGVLGWGSTMGAIIEAVDIANSKGNSVAALKQIVLNPLHEDDLISFCDDCESILIPELNYSGQFSEVVGARVGRPIKRYNRVTGRPITYVDVLEEIERVLR